MSFYSNNIMNNPFYTSFSRPLSLNESTQRQVDISCDLTVSGKIINESLDNKLERLENENNKLIQRVEKLERIIDDMIKYAPNNEGYEEAKDDFEKRLNQIN